jgi:hypothetical protein
MTTSAEARLSKEYGEKNFHSTQIDKSQRIARVDPILATRWPGCWVLYILFEIDNSDIGQGMTYKVEAAVYSEPSCFAPDMISPGFARSGKWHETPASAEKEVRLELLHCAEIDDAYRARQPCWRSSL